ncbi:hypothetical protein ASD64_18380 [Mesorhizobium sp. Root157]|uniref:hypothetical protein n=1 Tax=Mesorhizobium sp. Root157 TaxID=1736477 RepID=UPI000701AD6E|nr:hypothetical protein [Mesorhizobium sp. Root157]KQZ95874.1 hypothetical protein ASD64_18380 [Mesorhizobium sp. Root157]
MAVDEDSILAIELAYMAEHPELFTKKEMAAMLATASVAIANLRMHFAPRIDLEDTKAEGYRVGLRS